uniref:HET domain-containing protein n=1 Tax=Ascaris lumbricoides TaxID=6252 RepID=A0A0M3I2L4_ASCLU
MSDYKGYEHDHTEYGCPSVVVTLARNLDDAKWVSEDIRSSGNHSKSARNLFQDGCPSVVVTLARNLDDAKWVSEDIRSSGNHSKSARNLFQGFNADGNDGSES